MTPWDNCSISGYEGPNEISEDVPDSERTIISLVNVSYPEGETMTRGSPYKFTIIKSHEISHLGKTRISPNW